MTEVESRVKLPKSDSGNKGSYVLIVRLDEESTIAVGSLNTIHFTRGCYAYVGSAMGGFRARLNHHRKGSKRPHWHIDYLLQKAAINDIIICETEVRVECNIAQALSRQLDSIPGFGSSDCKCHSHLFVTTEEEEMTTWVMSSINRLEIAPGLRAGLSVSVSR